MPKLWVISHRADGLGGCWGRTCKNESGATAIEYGLIAARVSLAIIGVVSKLGSKLKTTFSSISTQLQ